MALTQIKGSESTEALRASLGYAKEWFLAVSIDALGKRKDQASYARFTELLNNKYEPAKINAFKAIGQLNRPESVKLIITQLKTLTSKKTSQKRSFAYVALVYSQNAVKAKRPTGIKNILEIVLDMDIASDVNQKALNIYASVLTDADAPRVMEYLKSSNQDIQKAAIKCVIKLNDDESYKAVTHMLSRFNTTVKPIAISALLQRSKGKKMGRHEAYAGKQIAKLINYRSQKVRLIAMKGVSQLGDPSTMFLVAKTGAMRAGKDETVAINSLAAYQGKWYKQTLIDGVGDETLMPAARLIMLKAARKRGIKTAEIRTELENRCSIQKQKTQ